MLPIVRLRAVRRTSRAAVLAALVFLPTCLSCSYLSMMNRQARLISQFDQSPSQKLAARIAPEGVFAVEGPLPDTDDEDLPLLITAIVPSTNELIGGHIVEPTFRRYWLYLPPGV